MTPTIFADSSALVKLYADEPDADRVRAEPLLVVSQVARVEVPAALWKKHRMGELSSTATAVLVAEFEADYFGTEDAAPRFVIVAVHASALDHAAKLVATHGLRAYDAVQLACALAARAASDEHLGFLAFDGPLAAAAATEGFSLPDT